MAKDHNIKKIYGFDHDTKKIYAIQSGTVPFYDPGLKTHLNAVLYKKFFPTMNFEILFKNSKLIFICIDVPSADNNKKQDVSNLFSVFQQFAMYLMKYDTYKLFIIRSTVLPGTTENFAKYLEVISGKKWKEDFGVVMMPEFLQEGRALEELLTPTRLVFGTATEKERELLKKLFKNFNCPKSFVNLETAEFIKYATNAYLALKISFANELANIIEHYTTVQATKRINIDEVVKILGYDPRINTNHMKAGIGFGGFCLPKDLKNFIGFAEINGYDAKILKAASHVNDEQPKLVVSYLKETFKSLHDKKIAVLGLSFKPGTDNVKNSPALRLIKILLEEGAKIKAYDPVAIKNAKRTLSHHHLTYHENISKALTRVDIAILVTEWKEIITFLTQIKNRTFFLYDCRGVIKDADGSLGGRIAPFKRVLI